MTVRSSSFLSVFGQIRCHTFRPNFLGAGSPGLWGSLFLHLWCSFCTGSPLGRRHRPVSSPARTGGSEKSGSAIDAAQIFYVIKKILKHIDTSFTKDGNAIVYVMPLCPHGGVFVCKGGGGVSADV